MPKTVQEELHIDRAASGDAPSTVMLGVYAAGSLRKDGIAIFMVDALGRIVIMRPASVKVLEKPRLSQKDLDGLSRDEAIRALLKQGDVEEIIIRYLEGRDGREDLRQGTVQPVQGARAQGDSGEG